MDAVVENLLDRLEDCRKAFPSTLCLGGSADAVRRLLRGRGGIESLIMMDMSADMVKKCSHDLIMSCLGLHWTDDLPGAMIQDGEQLYGICEAIDEEKDPECLMISFHVVEVVMKLFPNPSGLAAHFAGRFLRF
ncbi:putative methyltransferase [Zea mays]|uniref:Putative methyltransferase n=1 Tax=Zea mays TaxID=4577 RepID=A0A317YBW0_MAIZE|nr:putative methyltransferase [Zea mays]